jgi:predicted ATPase with chaperone activity
MTLAEALETTRLHRVAGRTGARPAWVPTRPCRAPHQTLSDAGLIGGQVPMPGEVSRAPHGMLFLDALPACRRHGLEGRRQPLEKSITSTQSPARHRPLRAGHAGSSADALKTGPSASSTHP